MSCLQVTISAKIIVTLVLWAMPALVAPAYAAQLLGMPEPRPVVFIRLLGAAFTALAFGYACGLIESLRGREVMITVWMGIVSNGLALLVILLSASEWRGWPGKRAQLFMWGSAAATGFITVALIVCGALPA